MPRRTLGVIALACSATFALLAVAVAGGNAPAGIEKPALDWLHPNPTGGWAHSIRYLATPVIVAAVVAALVVGARRRVLARVVLFVVLAAVAYLVGEHVVKPLVDRTYMEEVTFPSGNVTAACATAIALWLALWPVLDAAARRVTAVVGVTWVVTVSAAVVGAEWHTPLDDVGSVLLSVGVVTGGAILLERLLARPEDRGAVADEARRGPHEQRTGT